MPEGQVSHRNALRFTEALRGREIIRVDVGPRLEGQRIAERLVGDRIERVDASGKHHLFRFVSGRVLHSHLMMNGRWRLARTSEPVLPRNVWLAIATDEWIATQYNGPVLRLVEPGGRIPSVDALGPDLLDERVDPAAAAVAALKRCEGHRQVGEAIMDQRVMSGIGNVYKSETCFLAGVDPWREVQSLSDEEASVIGATASRLLAEGVRQPGRIQTHRPAGANPLSREDRWVYGRRGKPCRRCGTRVASRGQGDANRTTYWCPTCQT